jgi:sensor histidine kinase YesM
LETLKVDNKINVHIVVWLTYIFYFGLLLVYFYDIELSFSFVLQTLLFRLGEILLFYTNSLWVLPRYFFIRKIPLLVITFSLVLISFGLYSYFLEYYAFDTLNIKLTSEVPPVRQVISQAVNQASNIIIFSLGYYFSQRVIQQQKEIVKKDIEIANQKAVVAEQQVVLIKKEKELAEEREKNAILAKEKAQAEMAFLRAQINPHFLFNTLNLIHSKILTSSKQVASETIIDFSELMQYATGTKMQEDTVDLGGELTFVKQYLKLFKARNQQSAQIDYEEEGYFGSHRVLPMVLITIVENALKHGLVDDPNNPLIIRASLIDDFFIFMVRNLKNPYPHDVAGKGNTGVGVPNIIKRLHAVYKKGGFTLESEDLKDDYIVTFTINYKII